MRTRRQSAAFAGLLGNFLMRRSVMAAPCCTMRLVHVRDVGVQPPARQGAGTGKVVIAFMRTPCCMRVTM